MNNNVITVSLPTGYRNSERIVQFIRAVKTTMACIISGHLCTFDLFRTSQVEINGDSVCEHSYPPGLFNDFNEDKVHVNYPGRSGTN